MARRAIGMTGCSATARHILPAQGP
jgi:hypothetical protein